MAENKITDGNLALTRNERFVLTIEAADRPSKIELRVAAYVRVSSSSDDQLNSFVAQNKYYTTLVSGKKNWTLVDIYADEGITGTSSEKREDFKRLLSDCRKGKIDRILVKSISRFARNTKDCLEAIRELKLLGVSVFFEKENIDTATMSGEMMTALFASFAQAESQSISGNMRWSYQKRMQSGTFIPSSMPYGYKAENGKMVIDVDQAMIICEIFKKYLMGISRTEIAATLNKLSVKSGQNKLWHSSSIKYILTNEKYIGNSLWQKTYATDTFPVQYKKNNGERPQYYAQHTHPPIVSAEVFEAAQRLIKSREEAHRRPQHRQKSSMSSKLVCECCGSHFRRKINANTVYWSCTWHEKSASACPTKQIPEAVIHDAFCRMYFKLKHNTAILTSMLSSLQTIRNRRMLWSLDVIELNKKICDLISQNQMLAALKQRGLVDSDIFISQTNALTEQLRSAKLEKERLLNTEHDEAIASTKELIEILEDGPDFLGAFDEELFCELIDKIIVESNDRIRFRLKNGLELPETIERTVR